MKPLCTITTVATSLQQGVAGIIEQINYVLKDEELKYLETISQPFMEPPTFGHPQGKIVMNVCMILEAESFDQVARINEKLINAGMAKMQIDK